MTNPDGDWTPSGRPQSMIARNFSESLHDVFDIDNNIGGLTESVEQKKRAVDTQRSELEALEARIRETEDRLRERTSRTASPVGRLNRGGSPHRRHPVGDNLNSSERNGFQPSSSSPLAGQRNVQSHTDQVTSGAQAQRESPYKDYRQASSMQRKPVIHGQDL